MKKIIVLDVETTGDNHEKNGLVQVGAKIYVGGRLKENVDIRIKPHKGASIDVNKNFHFKNNSEIVLSDLEAFDYFISILDKHINKYDTSDKFYFIGYNSIFDEAFIRMWFQRNNHSFYGSYFHKFSICVMRKAMDVLCTLQEGHYLDRMQLRDVCTYFGIKVDKTKLHEALYDVSLTYQLYYKLEKVVLNKKSKKSKNVKTSI